MHVEQRIRACMLLEKMAVNQRFCKKIGLENQTTFRGERIVKEEVDEKCLLSHL